LLDRTFVYRVLFPAQVATYMYRKFYFLIFFEDIVWNDMWLLYRF